MSQLTIDFAGMIAHVVQPDRVDALLVNTAPMPDRHVPQIQVLGRAEAWDRPIENVEIEIEVDGGAAGSLQVDAAFLRRTLALDELHAGTEVGCVAAGALADRPDPDLVVGRMRMRHGSLRYQATARVEVAKFDIVKFGDPNTVVKAAVDIAEESRLVIPLDGKDVILRLREFGSRKVVLERRVSPADDHRVRVRISNDPLVPPNQTPQAQPYLHHFMAFYHLAGEHIEKSERLVPRLCPPSVPQVEAVKCTDGCWPACSNVRFAPPA